ncbi:hypothetical protein HDU96_003970 [Phlyctochytrium bullatum]|nr:hypothetical protein HDU96_003970 [Phlyctochytrium bullatum]
MALCLHHLSADELQLNFPTFEKSFSGRRLTREQIRQYFAHNLLELEKTIKKQEEEEIHVFSAAHSSHELDRSTIRKLLNIGAEKFDKAFEKAFAEDDVLKGKVVQMRQQWNDRRKRAASLQCKIRECFPLASDLVPVFQRADLNAGNVFQVNLDRSEGVETYVTSNTTTNNGSQTPQNRWHIPNDDVQELVLFNIKTLQRCRVMVGRRTLHKVPRFIAISHVWPKEEPCLEVMFGAGEVLKWNAFAMPMDIRYSYWVLRLISNVAAAISTIKDNSTAASAKRQHSFRSNSGEITQDMWDTDWIWLDVLCSDQWNQLWVRDNTYAMAFAYSAACMTLVMSHQLPSATADWISRRWTLQEARLSKYLVWCTLKSSAFEAEPSLEINYSMLNCVKKTDTEKSPLVAALVDAVSGADWKLSQGIYYSKLRDSYFTQDLVYSVAMMVRSIAGLRMVYDVPVDIVLYRAIAQAARSGDYSAIGADFESPEIQEGPAKIAMEKAFCGQAGPLGLNFIVYQLHKHPSTKYAARVKSRYVKLLKNFDQLFGSFVKSGGSNVDINRCSEISQHDDILELLFEIAKFIDDVMQLIYRTKPASRMEKLDIIENKRDIPLSGDKGLETLQNRLKHSHVWALISNNRTSFDGAPQQYLPGSLYQSKAKGADKKFSYKTISKLRKFTTFNEVIYTVVGSLYGSDSTRKNLGHAASAGLLIRTCLENLALVAQCVADGGLHSAWAYAKPSAIGHFVYAKPNGKVKGDHFFALSHNAERNIVATDEQETAIIHFESEDTSGNSKSGPGTRAENLFHNEGFTEGVCGRLVVPHSLLKELCHVRPGNRRFIYLESKLGIKPDNCPPGCSQHAEDD